ncbi:DUF3800 domain-containing protein [Methylosinus sp. H3A]|uniref:DUF3800 domain-containing protein n=1 Tax=Methylosinus sp. H3A TaxID=2785786 RepID=UPI0018C1F31C|nr:DUF3800 domain-containing protein [Methylosinus sp. H3A]MBG0812310.1 DUF3800 domain-containing protein [Methylosinus sp. H3A]MBG0812389.1 DUF3800 domain-containing protein [Methylosinus sp. H3A]
MNFTAYIDESDTHGPAPDMVMSAMLSTAGRWERCRRALTRIQREFGFTVFHASEFRALQGEFEGWSAEKCFDIYTEFGRLGASHLTECFTVSLSYETYKTYFLDRRPQKMHRTSQYGICFMGVLDGLMRTVMGYGPQSKLSVVVEDGHKNAKDTARLFEDRRWRLDTGGIDLLRSYALEKKECSPLLQLADITAHAHTKDKRAIKLGAAPGFSERNEEEPVPGQPGWSVYEVTPDYIARIIDEYESDRAAKHEDYLKRRRAWSKGRVASGAV